MPSVRPLEFKAPRSFKPIHDMVGGGPFRLRPGEWTDDTSMALCLASFRLRSSRSKTLTMRLTLTSRKRSGTCKLPEQINRFRITWYVLYKSFKLFTMQWRWVCAGHFFEVFEKTRVIKSPSKRGSKNLHMFNGSVGREKIWPPR